jgi:pimeloyl-ACP methyl ester carboxylesterase
MGEAMVRANGVEICTEDFGSPSDPALLLIMGATASMVWWPDDFCHLLAAGGRHVIRYDNRDTGRSITYPPGRPDYSMEDLAADARGVLDAWRIGRAHIAGMSLGGMIAQLLALRDPERVASLALLMTGAVAPDDPDLPPMDEKVLAYHRTAARLDWSQDDAVIDFMVGGWRLLTGSGHAFEDAPIRAIATRELHRSASLPSMFNHALLTGGERWYGRLGEIAAPTLVIHGTDDPVLPYPHGIALTNAIPGARLLTLPGTGHELHSADWETIAQAILTHTETAAARLAPRP